MAAKYAPEGEGLAGEGWNIRPEVITTLVGKGTTREASKKSCGMGL